MGPLTPRRVRSVSFHVNAPGLTPISLDCGTATTQPARAGDDQCPTVSDVVLLFPWSATSNGYPAGGADPAGITNVSSGRAAAESSSYRRADRSVSSRNRGEPRSPESRGFSSSQERL